MGTDLDTLVVGNCYLDKPRQDPSLRRSRHHLFEPD
jgi:hypothetical protein